MYAAVDEQRRELVWLDRQGRRLSAAADIGLYFGAPALSLDGKFAVVDRADSSRGVGDLWLVDLARSVSSRFTLDRGQEGMPVVSSDGRVAYAFIDAQSYGIRVKSTGDSDTPRTIYTAQHLSWPSSWTRDGSHIVGTVRSARTGEDIWLFPVEGPGEPSALRATEAEEAHARVSPDGRWLAYASNESAAFEVYVQSFPVSGRAQRISTSGGMEPRWCRDGKELFYRSGDGRLMAVPVTVGPTFQAGTPVALFQAPVSPADTETSYDVSADCQRFLLNAVVNDRQGQSLNVVLNWSAAMQP